MDSEELHSSVDDLASSIGDLEDSLGPLLDTALSSSTSRLPLLDKAKLYVLATYSIESLLFSYLRLNSVDAKTHPVFRELTRVRQYFEKIKLAESTGPKSKLDKAAAGRFVKHALAGNEQYDKTRAQQMDRENAGAKRKFEDMTERVGSRLRFEAMSKKMKADEEGGLVREVESDASEEVVDVQMSGLPDSAKESEMSKKEAKEAKAVRRQARADRKAAKSRSKLEETDLNDARQVPAEAEPAETVIPWKQKSNKAPKGHHEAFQGLLNGSLPKHEEDKDKKLKNKTRKERRQKAEDARAAELA